MSLRHVILVAIATLGAGLFAVQDERGVRFDVDGWPIEQVTHAGTPTSITFAQTLDLHSVPHHELQDGACILQSITLSVNKGGVFKRIFLEGLIFTGDPATDPNLPNFSVVFSQDRAEVTIKQEEFGETQSLIFVINTETVFPKDGEYLVSMTDDLEYILLPEGGPFAISDSAQCKVNVIHDIFPESVPYGMGAKYVGVDVHGVPKPDASPTGEGESDRAPNQAYTDMLNLEPRYAVTDMAVPVEGGELVNEFRRNTGIKGYTYGIENADLYRHNPPVRFLLGPGWDCNIGSHIQVNYAKQEIDSASVQDEVGNSFSFTPAALLQWQPDVKSSMSNDSMRAKLEWGPDTGPWRDTLILTKTFGTKCFYRKVQWTGPHPAHQHPTEYFRLEKVVDRNGNTMEFLYLRDPQGPEPIINGEEEQFLAREIREARHPERRLRFTYQKRVGNPLIQDTGWRVTSVTDPLGRRIDYVYGGDDFLNEVRQPAVADEEQNGASRRPTVKFTYDRRILDVTRDSNKKFWTSPGAITDARGHVTTFTYREEKFRATFGGLDSFEMRPTAATCTTVDGTANFETDLREVDHIKTHVIDTRGTRTSYDFDMVLDRMAPNKAGVAVYLETITRTTHGVTQPDGGERDLSAIFQFAPDPNANLIRTTDLSGNIIEWVYDSGDETDPYNKGIFKPDDPVDAERNPSCYQSINQPAKRIVDPQGLNLVTEYRYERAFNKLIHQIDAELKATDHEMDEKGNRVALHEPLGRITRFDYDNEGFIVKSTDPDARVTIFAKQFNAGIPNAYYRLTTRVRGYNEELDIASVSVSDIMGNTRRTIDPKGNVTVSDYDALNRPISVTRPAVMDGRNPDRPPQATTSYTYYDLNGNAMRTVDDEGNVSVTFYDPMNRPYAARRRMANPNRDNDARDLITSTTYNEVGLPDTSTEANGNRPDMPRGSYTTSFEYDELLRLTKKILPPVVEGTLPGTAGVPPAPAAENPIRYVETYQYGTNCGSGMFTILSGWQPTRVINPRGYATDTTYDKIYRAVQVIRRDAPNGGNASPSDPPAAGEPCTITEYNRVHKPVHVQLLNENFSGQAANQNTYTFYDDLYRTTVAVVDMDGDGPGVPVGVFVNDPSAFVGDADDLVSRTVYDFNGNALAVTDAEGRTSNSQYDGAGRVVKTMLPEVEVTEATSYVLAGGGTGRIRPTTEVQYDLNSNKEIVIDPHFTKTKTFFDARNRLIQVIVDLNGDGQFDPSFNGPDTVSKTLYSFADKPVVTTDSRGNSTETEYDRAYRVTRVTGPRVRDAEQGNAWVRPVSVSEYDHNSNVVSVRDPRGVETVTEYDGLNRARKVTAAFQTADAVTTEKRYDPNNNVRALILHNRVDTNGNGTLDANRPQVTSYAFDSFDRQIRETLPDIGDGQARVTQSTYYRNGQVKAVTDAKGQIVDSSYDLASRVTETRHLRTAGVPPAPVAEETRTFLYNKVGKPTHIADLNGATDYVYDELYRVLEERRTNVGQTSPSAAPYAVQSRYDTNGNRTKCIYPNAAGVAGAGRTLVSLYDRLNRLTRMEDYGNPLPSAGEGRDEQSRVRGEGAPKVTQYTYDANGNRLSLSVPNGAVDRYDYDNLNRVAAHSSKKGDALIYDCEYRYDLVGNRLRIDETLADADEPDNPKVRHMRYAYDQQYRLVLETWAAGNIRYPRPNAGEGRRERSERGERGLDGPVGVDAETRSYTFDLAGNRATMVVEKPEHFETTRYSYDDLNRLLTATTNRSTSEPANQLTFSYDINGNRQTKTVGGVTDSYTWDVNDRLVRVDRNGAQVFNANYDYRTRRTAKSEKKDDTLKTTAFRYDQGDSFQELSLPPIPNSLPPAVQVEFVRGSGMGGGIGSILYSDRFLSPIPDPLSPAVEYFHYNAVGHTVATSNAGGTVQSSSLYEAYGNIVLSTGSSQNNRLANTKERDFAIGLDNHGRRYFDSDVGRYVNPDPIGYGDGPNWWVYVQNNPINFIDPLGLGGGNAPPRVQPKPQPQPQPKPGPVIPERNSVGPYRVTGEVFLGNLTQARVDAELYEIHRHNAANLRSGTVREEYEMRERELEIREEESQYGIPSPARSRRASDAFGKAKEVSQSRPPAPLEARSSQYRSSRPASNTDMFANARDLPTKEQIRTGRSAEPEWARSAPSYEQWRAALAAQNGGSGGSTGIPEVPVSRARSPEALRHLRESGWLDRELTIDRSGTKDRRRENMEGVETKSGFDRDESPPAMFKESQDASVRLIPSGDNRSAGGQIGGVTRNLPDQSKVILREGE